MKAKIKQRYLLLKRRIADNLQAKTERLSVANKKLLLMLFCSCFITLSVCAIVNAFTAKQKPLAVKSNMPRMMQQHEQQRLPFLSKQEFDRIEKYKQRIYSLPKQTLDSFLQARPKLLDSITAIEQIYQSQK